MLEFDVIINTNKKNPFKCNITSNIRAILRQMYVQYYFKCTCNITSNARAILLQMHVQYFCKCL